MGKLITYDSVRVAIAATVGKIIPKIKAKHWENIAQAMLDACIVEQGTDDMEWEGAARMYLHAYLSETGFIPSIESQRLRDQRRMMPSGTTHQAVSTLSNRRSDSYKAGVLWPARWAFLPLGRLWRNPSSLRKAVSRS